MSTQQLFKTHVHTLTDIYTPECETKTSACRSKKVLRCLATWTTLLRSWPSPCINHSLVSIKITCLLSNSFSRCPVFFKHRPPRGHWGNLFLFSFCLTGLNLLLAFWWVKNKFYLILEACSSCPAPSEPTVGFFFQEGLIRFSAILANFFRSTLNNFQGYPGLRLAPSFTPCIPGQAGSQASCSAMGIFLPSAFTLCV